MLASLYHFILQTTIAFGLPFIDYISFTFMSIFLKFISLNKQTNPIDKYRINTVENNPCNFLVATLLIDYRFYTVPFN